jgi:outer membrane receptor protein involved in Fe transport
MKIKKIISSILSVFLLVFYANAQSSGSIKGRIIDSNQTAVAGAKVTAQTKIGTSTVQTQTNSNGEYEFNNLANGEYKLTVEANGFSRSVRVFRVADKTSEPLVIELSVGNLTETVTVTATRTQISTDDTTVPVSIVGRDQIERKAVNTIGDVFRSLPGTSTVNEGAFQVRPRIRGLDSNRVLVLVDGERLNNSRTSTAQSGIEIGLVEASQVETLEVVRGSGSVLYGTDALAGTINIITRDTPARRESGFRFGSTLDTFYSTNENGRRGSLSVNGSGKLFAFRVSQSLDRFENYFTGNRNGRIVDGVTANNEVLNGQSHGRNTSATGRFFIKDASTLRLNYERRRSLNIGTPTLVGTFNAYFPFSNRDKVSGRFDTVNLTKNLVRFSLSSFYQQQKRNFSNIVTVPPAPPFFPGVYQFSETVTNTKTNGFDLQTDWIFGNRNTLTAGVSFFRDKNNDDRIIISSTTAASPNQRRSNSKSVPDAALSNIAAFAQDEFKVTNKLKFVGGIRFDSFNTNSQPTTGFAISPLLTVAQVQSLGLTDLPNGLKVNAKSVTGDFGVVFNASKNVILSSRIGRSFRSPNIFERFFTDFGSTAGFVVGSPNLKPESGVNFDSTVRFRSTRFVGSATYFHNYFKDFLSNVLKFSIPRNPPLAAIPLLQTVNITKARIQGFEIEVEAPFKLNVGYLTPYANYSFLHGDNLENNTKKPLDFISPSRTNAGIRWQNLASNYFVDYNVRIVTKQTRLSDSFRTDPLTGYQPGFVTHNISGGYAFKRENFNFKLNLGLSNFFNRYYKEQFVFAPARGRSFTVGTSWEIK